MDIVKIPYVFRNDSARAFRVLAVYVSMTNTLHIEPNAPAIAYYNRFIDIEKTDRLVLTLQAAVDFADVVLEETDLDFELLGASMLAVGTSLFKLELEATGVLYLKTAQQIFTKIMENEYPADLDGLLNETKQYLALDEPCDEKPFLERLAEMYLVYPGSEVPLSALPTGSEAFGVYEFENSSGEMEQVVVKALTNEKPERFVGTAVQVLPQLANGSLLTAADGLLANYKVAGADRSQAAQKAETDSAIESAVAMNERGDTQLKRGGSPQESVSAKRAKLDAEAVETGEIKPDTRAGTPEPMQIDQDNFSTAYTPIKQAVYDQLLGPSSKST